MAQYKSFRNEKRKLEKLWEDSNELKKEISNNVKKINVYTNNIDFTKSIIRISIASNILIGDDQIIDEGGEGG